jgi:hypothetical protein
MMNSMDNTDIDTYYPVMGDIDHEPLISNKAHQAVPFTMRCLDFLSFLTGSYLAAGYQLLLSPLMQYTHPKIGCQIACLWMALTVLTWLVVCLGMRAWMCLVLRGRSVQDEALSIKLQVYYIVGSFVGFSLILQSTSFLIRAPPVAALLAVVAIVLWSSFLLYVIHNTNHSYDGKGKGSNNSTSTYQLAGFKIGLITGLTQLVLCISLYGWMDTAASAIWLGGATFIWTAAGWAGMHLIDQDCEHMESSYSRMEYYGYILFGICLAWIGIMCLAWVAVDWVYNKRENAPLLLLVTLILARGFKAAVHLLGNTSYELEEREGFV